MYLFCTVALLLLDSGVKCYNLSDTYVPMREDQDFFNDTDKFFNDSLITEQEQKAKMNYSFEHNPTYSPFRLPQSLLCSYDVPSSVFVALNKTEKLRISSMLNEVCNGTDPEVNAALVSDIESFSEETFKSLGKASVGLNRSQISSVPPQVLMSSLSILGSVDTWNKEQAMTIIQTISRSGNQFKTSSSLSSLGTLVRGVSSKMIEDVPSPELLSVAENSTFVNNMRKASPVVRRVFVQKIISLDQSPASLVKNVPDELATEIPPTLLLFEPGTLDINQLTQLNKKTWTQRQAAMFFETLSTAELDTEELSPSVLQGFTCTAVRKASKTQIMKLVRACRKREGRSKVVLKESQLTCMYNHLKGSLTQNFTEYPSDLLIYFNARDVDKTNCRSYFSALGAADFTVPSRILNKPEQLFSEAQSCLGITDTNLSEDNVMVLGNLICMLDGSYIQNSDPSVLKTLRSCKDLSESQVAAIQTLLLSGRTPYGNVSAWNVDTLKELDPLPLYFTRNVWGQVQTGTKKMFLKRFIPKLKESKTVKNKLKALFKEVRAHRVKRGAGCTVGNITTMIISDASFLFDYDATQLDLCLEIPVLMENLNSICDKIDDDDDQMIILRKLNEAYPAGVSDENVQVLDSVSRMATLSDISKWNITSIDTLSALMDTDDGPWEAAKSRAVITKYLTTSGSSLGTNELDAIDSNLCALDTAALNTITTDSLRNATALNVTLCSLEQKKVLYEISSSSLSSFQSSPASYFSLIMNYLGGAPLADIQTLSTQDIHMDISTFQILDTNVVNKLTVSEVQTLLGSNVADLKTFEKAPMVETWIHLQRQSDLDILGLGLSADSILVDQPTPTSTSGANSSLFMLVMLMSVLQLHLV